MTIFFSYHTCSSVSEFAKFTSACKLDGGVSSLFQKFFYYLRTAKHCGIHKRVPATFIFNLIISIFAKKFFNNVRIPEANVLPGVSSLKGPLSCLTQARYGISWGVIGAAQACLDEVLKYTEDRVLFGRPIAHTQSIQIRMAEMCRQITTAQLLSLRLGRIKDKGDLSPTQVSLAKWNNCRAAIDIARDARDILGGAGISAEYVPIRHMLNLESVITYEGTETVHQLVVGKELTGTNAF